MMMINSFSTVIITSLLVSSQLVLAFTNTYPLLAWSNQKLDSLTLLSPSHQSNSPSIFRPSSPQTPFPDSNSLTTDDDLCSLNSILLISIPGLHSNDLNFLPSPSKSSNGIRSGLINAGKAIDRSLNLLYIPFQSQSKGRSQAGATAEKFVKKYISECGAVVEKANEKNFWGGEGGKSLKVEVVEGLEDWELVGVAARKERSKIMQKVDLIVRGNILSLKGPYLVIVTSIPSSVTSTLHQAVKHTKRQEEEYNSYSDSEGGEFGEFEFDPTLPMVVPQESSRLAAAPKPTSIFEVDPKSGLFHRYVFFNQPLIFALIISLVILIPVVFMGSQALTSIETLAGLEGKMTGSVGVDPSKSS